jgi:hypothetical protein
MVQAMSSKSDRRTKNPPDSSVGSVNETKELIAGYWIWQVASMEEAIAWVKRCPNPMPGESEIEIRPIFTVEDFRETFTPELREQEDRIRAAIDNP